MNLFEKIHESYVHNRRVRVLTRELSELLPANGQVLDVGCGDWLLAALIQKDKPTWSLQASMCWFATTRISRL